MRSRGKAEKAAKLKGTWGGRREGAGRKPSGKAGVPHRTRPEHSPSNPVLVTIRVLGGVPNLRSKKMWDEIWVAVKCGSLRSNFHIVHFSVEPDRIHLIVEADDVDALQRGLQGFAIRFARGLNAVLRRKGKLIADRYDAKELTTPQEVRDALKKVLFAWRAHDKRAKGPDPLSSARYHDVWRPECRVTLELDPSPRKLLVMPPETALLSKGWKKLGLLSVDEAM